MAVNVSPDRKTFRERAREDPTSRLIRSTTLDHRSGKRNTHKCAMAVMPDGFYVEGGLRLPKELIVTVREALSIDPILPTYFVDERWFDFKRLRASFDGLTRIIVDSKDWSVVSIEEETE